ncbi:ATP-binding protein [Pseudomonas sp. ArH3a]|uniref:ATP-dependent nuclease n=1 Tax=Pseudomonas sp. ArH3a TaxID=2862945 RepID=UPI001F597FC4|nr:AAA family ATPase [Pseudomonas sp. ArH3a]UNM19270.1 ATP-binding protein [Pseudomonas sp. ArH3a]
MKIDSLRVKNFRTISSEQILNISGGLTLVGPNNAGKTNALMALYMFFTGYENNHSYNYLSDLSFADKTVKTSLTCHFTSEEGDDEVLERLAKLRAFLGQDDDDGEFSINVYFNGNNPVYQVYPGVKRPEGKSPQYSMAQKAFVQSVLDCFKCYYIPSKKSIDELYNEFVSPFIRLKVGQALEEHLPKIRQSVAMIAKSMNGVLSRNGLENITVGFGVPNGAISDLITGFDLHVSDPDKSSIYSKGMGVQAAVLLSSFKWITEQQKNLTVIWLVEEPESYMHPALASQASKILDGLSSISILVKTTHAINFVPSDINLVQGVARVGKTKNTVVKAFNTHREATEAIRKSLGVKFSDYFALSRYSLFVEGETDKTYIEHIWGQMREEQKAKYPYLNSSEFFIKDFTGVSDLLGFLKSNFGLFHEEICAVSLFDGDKAGVDAARAMSGFCANKEYSFNPNREYVLIPGGHPIEGMFPDQWILDAYEHEAAWFDGGAPIVDADDKLISFKIRDSSKKAFMSFVLELYDEDGTYDSSQRFFSLFKAINASFERQDLLSLL